MPDEANQYEGPLFAEEQLRAELTEALEIIKGLLRIAGSAPYSAVHGDEEWIERAAVLLDKHRAREKS